MLVTVDRGDEIKIYYNRTHVGSNDIIPRGFVSDCAAKVLSDGTLHLDDAEAFLPSHVLIPLYPTGNGNWLRFDRIAPMVNARSDASSTTIDSKAGRDGAEPTVGSEAHFVSLLVERLRILDHARKIQASLDKYTETHDDLRHPGHLDESCTMDDFSIDLRGQLELEPGEIEWALDIRGADIVKYVAETCDRDLKSAYLAVMEALHMKVELALQDAVAELIYVESERDKVSETDNSEPSDRESIVAPSAGIGYLADLVTRKLSQER